MADGLVALTTDRARLRLLVERNGMLGVLTELVALCRELPSPLHDATAERLLTALNARPPLRTLTKTIEEEDQDETTGP